MGKTESIKNILIKNFCIFTNANCEKCEQHLKKCYTEIKCGLIAKEILKEIKKGKK